MFATKQRLIERTGFNDIGRYDYLKLLATEFKVTKSKEAKRQVLANLANFSYDPINYNYIRQLRIIDIFLHTLSDDDKLLVTYAIGGVCNLCTDRINRDYITRNQGVQLISSLLSSTEEDCVLSAITALIFIIDESSKGGIITSQLINQLVHLSNSTCKRIKNLATIFLTDYCNTDEVMKIRQSIESTSVASTSMST